MRKPDIRESIDSSQGSVAIQIQDRQRISDDRQSLPAQASSGHPTKPFETMGYTRFHVLDCRHDSGLLARPMNLVDGAADVARPDDMAHGLVSCAGQP